MKQSKRVLALALAIVMTIALLPGMTLTAFAADHVITIDSGITNGTITTNKDATGADAGEQVTIKAESDFGYARPVVTVTGDSTSTPVTVNDKYQFTMPAEDVTITATFAAVDTTGWLALPVMDDMDTATGFLYEKTYTGDDEDPAGEDWGSSVSGILDNALYVNTTNSGMWNKIRSITEQTTGIVVMQYEIKPFDTFFGFNQVTLGVGDSTHVARFNTVDYRGYQASFIPYQTSNDAGGRIAPGSQNGVGAGTQTQWNTEAGFKKDTQYGVRVVADLDNATISYYVYKVVSGAWELNYSATDYPSIAGNTTISGSMIQTGAEVDRRGVAVIDNWLIYKLEAETEFAVTVDGAITNGSVTTDAAGGKAEAGDTVTLTVTPDTGYEISEVSYNDGTKHVITIAEGVYKFTMPSKAVEVSAAFVAEGVTEYDVTAATGLVGGTVTADVAKAEAGDIVTITPVVKTGFTTVEVAEVSYTDTDGKHVVTIAEGAYKFTMPAKDVEVSAVFAPKAPAGTDLSDWEALPVLDNVKDYLVKDTFDGTTDGALYTDKGWHQETGTNKKYAATYGEKLLLNTEIYESDGWLLYDTAFTAATEGKVVYQFEMKTIGNQAGRFNQFPSIEGTDVDGTGVKPGWMKLDAGNGWAMFSSNNPYYDTADSKWKNGGDGGWAASRLAISQDWAEGPILKKEQLAVRIVMDLKKQEATYYVKNMKTGVEYTTNQSGATIIGADAEPFDLKLLTGKAVAEINTICYQGNGYQRGAVLLDNIMLYTLEPTYAATVDSAVTGGTITLAAGTADVTDLDGGEEVTITATPDTGYALVADSITVTGASGTVTVTDGKFTMPAEDVEVTATFEARYAATVGTLTDGAITLTSGADDVTALAAGAEVTIAVEPAVNYQMVADSLKVTGASGEVTVTDNKFTMPAEDVEVTAEFEEAPMPTAAPGDPEPLAADTSTWTALAPLDGANYLIQETFDGIEDGTLYTKNGWHNPGSGDTNKKYAAVYGEKLYLNSKTGFGVGNWQKGFQFDPVTSGQLVFQAEFKILGTGSLNQMSIFANGPDTGGANPRLAWMQLSDGNGWKMYSDPGKIFVDGAWKTADELNAAGGDYGWWDTRLNTNPGGAEGHKALKQEMAIRIVVDIDTAEATYFIKNMTTGEEITQSCGNLTGRPQRTIAGASAEPYPYSNTSSDLLEYVDRTFLNAYEAGEFLFDNILVYTLGGEEPTPTPPGPGDITVSGTIAIAGSTKTATVNIYKGTEKVATTTADAEGKYTVALPATAEAGEYIIEVTKALSTSYKGKVTLAAGANTGIDKTIYAGEVTGDGKINIIDVALVIAAYDKEMSDYDVDGDGASKVGLIDVTTTIGNYGKRNVDET